MTRAELQQVRDALEMTRDVFEPEDGVYSFDHVRIVSALALLDVELNKPEAREWGTMSLQTGDTDKESSEATARALAAEFPLCYAVASRTPNGPWEAQ